MNRTDRLERELTTWFADTAAPQTPDWTADILAATSTMRQRPRWSFPARWLPAAVIPRLPQLTRRPVPWRTIALLAALALLLAAAVTLYVGSRPRLPAPFGLAANGLVAYAELGEIWTVDPTTGERTKIVSMAGGNQAPRFSRDGTHVAFLREIDGGELLAITRADGTRLVESKGAPFVGADIDSIVWSPDGHSVAVVADSDLGRTIYLVDTITGEVGDLDTPGVDVEPYWRPPDGRELIYARTAGGDARYLVLVDIEAPAEQERPVSDTESYLRPGGWTPDGSRFVVHHFDDERGPWTSLLDPETGLDEQLEVGYGRVSNDGTRIVGYDMFLTEPSLCVMTFLAGPCDEIASGAVLPEWEHTAGLQWSPDDRWIAVYPQDGRGWLLLNPEGGPPITPVWSERGIESWQRLAP
jgi:dipeptidyl aminopeptidase/acylaminoacyl peptidase